MKVEIQFYWGETEVHYDVWLLGKDEATGFVKIEFAKDAGVLEREIFFPIDNIRKMIVIHKKE